MYKFKWFLLTDLLNDYVVIDLINNNLRFQLYCCGVHGSNDWNRTIGAPPESCYSDQAHTFIYGTGCLDKLSDVVHEGAILIGSGAICVAVVQVI